MENINYPQYTDAELLKELDLELSKQAKLGNKAGYVAKGEENTWHSGKQKSVFLRAELLLKACKNRNLI